MSMHKRRALLFKKNMAMTETCISFVGNFDGHYDEPVGYAARIARCQYQFNMTGQSGPGPGLHLVEANTGRATGHHLCPPLIRNDGIWTGGTSRCSIHSKCIVSNSIIFYLNCIYHINSINSLTAIRVLAGTKNSRPVGFYSRNSTKSTVNPNTTIPQI